MYLTIEKSAFKYVDPTISIRSITTSFAFLIYLSLIGHAVTNNTFLVVGTLFDETFFSLLLEPRQEVTMDILWVFFTIIF